MEKPWTSPALQAAESAKYVPAQHVVVPTCDGLAVYRCRGAARELISIFDQPDDLAGYFVQHFTAAQADCRAEQVRAASRKIDPLADLDLGDLIL